MSTKTHLLACSLLFNHAFGGPLCKNNPSDPTWPSDNEWGALNSSTGGALIKASPVASSCYDGNPFNSPLSCNEVQEEWFSSEFHASLPESIDYPYWANSSCVPPNDYDYHGQACKQVATATKWASSRNIRIIIKGTGHDLNGRSSGAYSLSIWTHQLKKLEFDAEWPRPLGDGTENAAIVGSGNNWGSIIPAAAAVGRSLVSGQLATVGVGGFVGGGGHGPLSSHYGLAADHILQATIVTTEDQILVANEAQNQDLLWAIRGGGPGLYGVVIEYVMRTHPVPQNVVTAILSMSMVGNDTTIAANASWDALTTLTSSLPDLMDLGLTGSGTASTVDKGVQVSLGFFAYNTTASTLNSILEPVRARMAAYGNNKTLSVTISEPTAFSTFLSFFNDYLNSSPTGVAQISLVSSRLLGRRELTDIPSQTLRFHLQDIMRTQVEGRACQLIYGLQGGLGPKNVDMAMRGALNPAWRSAYVHLITTGAYVNQTDSTPQGALATAATWVEENKEAVWRQWAPGSGAYFNEANPFNGNFREDFFGGNYDDLLKIKEKYDPTASLYTLSRVGSHLWDYNLDTGKLCQK
ncbi:FAD-dependent monooxygenase [Hypoxylon crocopeplum]|nr:FAD-dependent monooxygenase [Hypoxylon crocopeplum]